DIRTGHPDEVHKAVRDRVSGGSDIVDLGGVQHGDVRMRTFHLGHGIEERCRLVAGTRYDLRQAGGRLDRPDDNVDEANPQGDVASQQGVCCIEVQPVGPTFVNGHPYAEDHVVADDIGDGADDAFR